MKQRRSEIFDEYSKIALKEGFITESAEKADNSDEKSYRETIKLLYDVKPNGKDEKHILDQAHPESPVIIAPAYDRLNGRVENLFERQDVMVGIALKPTNGNLTQHRYAKQELTEELIRIGFEMDNKDIDDLRVLADSCSERITKQAFWGLAGAGAVVTGLIYSLVKTHVMDKTSQGVFNDGVILMKALKAASDNAEPRDKALMLNVANEIKSLLERIRAIRNLPQTEVDMYKASHISDIVAAGEKYKGAASNLIESYLADRRKVVNKLEELQYAIEGKSAEQPERYEFLADIRKIYNEVSGWVGGTAESTFIEVKRAIGTFIDSLKKEDDQIKKAMTTSVQFAVKNESAIKQQIENASTPAPSQPNTYLGPAKPQQESAKESIPSFWDE
jgi:hypothetical protein